MRSFDGVLFDFGHTLFDSVPASQHCRRFEEAHGVAVDDELFAALWWEIQQRSRAPEELAKGRDLSLDLHEACWVSLLSPLDGLSTGVVSNTGWDIREVFRHYELDQYVDAFVLSCDHGVVKPDVTLFEIALAELGVTCLILPRIDRTAQPSLGAVLALTAG